MGEQISDEELLKLWRNPDFEGSYRGIKVFQTILKTNLDISVSSKRLYKVIQHDSIYLLHKKPNRNILRRFYYVRYYGEVVQVMKALITLASCRNAGTTKQGRSYDSM